MKYINKEKSIFEMSPDNEPVEYCDSGEIVVFETYDCFGGHIAKASDLPGDVPDEDHNRATGPLYVNGAEAGDALKIEILRIDLANAGNQALKPDEGPLGSIISEECSRIFSIKDNQVLFNKNTRIPVSPMIGVIGTAPVAGSIENVIPGEHGSNMDNNKIQAGTTLYLPVNVPGGLLAIGDLHAVMGNGEVSTCGIETAGEVEVRVTLVKDMNIPMPLLNTETEYITIASAVTLDEAADNACLKMHALLSMLTELEPEEINMLMSATGNLEICQVVNPFKTVRMTMPVDIVDRN